MFGTVARPRKLFFFLETRDFAAVAESIQLEKSSLAQNLVVLYKEISDRDGFIVTAFPMSHRRMRWRFRRWQRLR